MSKFDFKKYFPFVKIRPQQSLAIDFAINAFENGKKFVIIELGTGCGKSATGVCISRYVQRHIQTKEIGTWFLTTQKILQEQYIRDFGGEEIDKIKSIKSSSSYICQLHKFDNVPDIEKMKCGEVHRLIRANPIFKIVYQLCHGNEKSGSQRVEGDCCYKKDKSKFLKALESITNYSYFFSESKYAGGIQKRGLLVLDECHTIEEQLSNFVEISISEKFAINMLKLKVPNFKNQDAVVKWIKNKYIVTLTDKVKYYATLLEYMENATEKIETFQEYARKHDLLDKHMCKVNRFLKTYTNVNWVMNEIPAQGKSLRKFSFKPVDVSEYAHEHLFSFGTHVLLMSATVLDKEIFCQSLGIPLDQVEFLRIDSPFDVKNRLIHIVPVGSMSKKAIDITLPKMSEAVQYLLEQHPNDKGIIHCTNFKIANYLIESIANYRLISHDSHNREQVLRMHEESDQPTVIISPSMMEGVDLADDKSRFQIICKIPFPYLGDDVVKKRMQKNSKWYDYRTVMSLIQSFGRSIRNENDYAISYVLDSDWNIIYNRSRNMFPNEFKKAIQK